MNRLTSSHTDPVTHTPAYKEASRPHARCWPRSARARCRASTHRFGHPTPQHGVEVERKWRRADYHPPGNRSGNGLLQIVNKIHDNGK